MTSIDATPSTPTQQRRTLVVFDYDCSLVNEGSDARFCKMFCPELLVRLDMPPHTPPPQGWPALMDELIVECFQQHAHVTQDDVTQALAQIAVSPSMLDAVRLAVDDFGATVVIVSDANSVFIEAMLAHHGLRDRVAEIHTNEGVWEATEDGVTGGRLRVRPYHSLDQPPHGCALSCPANMCKGYGRILDTLRAKAAYDVVLYVGDGIGDFCPSTRLSPHDTVFARTSKDIDNDNPDSESFGLLHRIQSHVHNVRARVVPWRSGSDIYAHFHAALGEEVSANSTASTIRPRRPI